MSEEEKKAIEYWKNIRDTHIAGSEGHRNAIVLLNLIEKQNKKIEELEKKNDVLATNYETLDLDICAVVRELGFIPEDIILSDELVPMIKENYIPKSKIRNMIKELEEAKESDCGSDKGVEILCNGLIAIYKELLGEEK